MTKKEPEEPPKTAAPFTFQPATKRQAKLRLALDGPSGSGKTYSALAIAAALGERIALIDTEHGSASKYAGDPCRLNGLHPEAPLRQGGKGAPHDTIISVGLWVVVGITIVVLMQPSKTLKAAWLAWIIIP